jgi:hypothetical protein
MQYLVVPAYESPDVGTFLDRVVLEFGSNILKLCMGVHA